MSKTLEYWRNKWDQDDAILPPRIEINEGDFDTSDVHNYNGAKTLSLLSSYSKSYKELFGMGASILRFFTGHWATHHGDAVQNVLEHYYGIISSDVKFHPALQTESFILACLKKQIGENPISSDGDLYKILQVIKEKTGVDYFELNPDEVFKRASARMDNEERQRRPYD